MNDFDYDCLIKKRIASGAKHRKSGGGRRCTLMSDHLTTKQWERKNGPVVEFSLNSTCEFNEFRKLSETVQNQYVDGLVARYGVDKSHFAQMLGVSYTTLYRYEKETGLAFRFPRKRMTRRQKEAWSLFCGSGLEEAANHEEDAQPEEDPIASPSPSPSPDPTSAPAPEESEEQEELVPAADTPSENTGQDDDEIPEDNGADCSLDEESPAPACVAVAPADKPLAPAPVLPVQNPPSGLNRPEEFSISFNGDASLEAISHAVITLLGSSTIRRVEIRCFCEQSERKE